jgi:helicase (fragment)
MEQSLKSVQFFTLFTLFTIFKLRYQSDTEFFVNLIEYNKIPNKGRFYE